MKKKGRVYRFVMLFLCMLFFSTGCRKEQEVYLEEEEQEDTSQNPKEEETDKKESIFVYVCGAVQKPGVYKLEADERVCDALEAAGGFTKEAAADNLNQAETLSDGEMIRVLTAEETANQQAEEEKNGLVNINTADAQELMQLSGIGQSKADAIIAYREEHGAFQSIDELMNISGIKEGVYNKIKDSITVN